MAQAPRMTGFPSPAQDFMQQELSLDRLCMPHPESTFLVRVAAGGGRHGYPLQAGDVLVVDRARLPRRGDWALLDHDGQFSVQPLPATAPCDAAADDPASLGNGCTLFGVVTYLLRAVSAP
ncbi:MAG: UV protection and mutation protein [Aeromonadaceae bacterium]